MNIETAVAFFQYIPPQHRRKVILFSFVGVGLLQYLFLFWRKSKRYEKLNKKISDRRKLADLRKATVKKQCSKSPDTEHIVVKTATCIVNEIINGQLKAEDVLHAFQKKALDCNSSLNFITELLPEAEEVAKELDRRQEKSGLLYGLPVSIKEHIVLNGYDATGGMEVFVNQIYDEDSVVVKALRAHGAVPFVRTNIPQTMKSFSSSNPIYKETSNPHDLTRGPGGSSSGEGAILGCGASVVGIGSDVGGSIRVPADFCGVYGLKPTVGRVSLKGVMKPSGGQLIIQGTAGPMARDLQSLVLMSRAMLSPEMYHLDNSLPYLPFRKEEYEKSSPLRIGFFTFDGTTKCQPSNIRAVMEAKAALEKQGHELIPFDFYTLLDGGFSVRDHYVKVLVPDRGENSIKLLKNDEVEKSIKLAKLATSLPPWIFRLLNATIGHLDKHFQIALSLCIGFRSVAEYLDNIAAYEKWTQSFMKLWEDQRLDAVICPVFCAPAPLKKTIEKVTVAGTYTFLWNAVNYPAGVVPVTKVTKQDIVDLDTKYKPESLFEKMMVESSRTSEGLSVGVQCAALPFREETVLRVMRDLDLGLGRVHGSKT